ncbi:6-phosphofructokinase [Mycoplasmopsis alligatoris]|uniref:ATP-dependent 6-phosphofructokinase n=1 Tax=Mycoplasmopsis alligatoris A21JP2 TaxID=747682 RepID=D4XV16_9BACT|nr:6-phosphofructokinase [Mycoplasmopsis alligatoris]EFF41822.1 6-phosphofructokinase [Mycoplasmopsis alligatoris A21JP2]
MRKIAILTSGGDAPGMNSALCSIIRNAKSHNLEVFVVLEGYKGLVDNNIVSADTLKLNELSHQGGTAIYSARYPEFKELSVRKIAVKNLKDKDIDALIVIGGDGSYMGAQLLHELGVHTIGLPGTIDNDIASSDFTIGYDTALNTIVEAIDKIRDTANSHKGIMIVEVMGNECGDLALYSGLATGAEIIATSDYVIPMEQIANDAIELTKQEGRRSIIVLVSEKRYDLKSLEKMIQEKTGWTTRSNSLAHTQRGGRPTAQERILSSLMGIKAVDYLLEGKSGLAIGIVKNDIVGVPILEALSMKNPSKLKAREKVIKFNKLNKML